MQILALLAIFGPQNVPLIQTSGNFLGWLHMVWFVIYQIKPLVLYLVTLDFLPLSLGFENFGPSVVCILDTYNTDFFIIVKYRGQNVYF